MDSRGGVHMADWRRSSRDMKPVSRGQAAVAAELRTCTRPPTKLAHVAAEKSAALLQFMNQVMRGRRKACQRVR